MTKFGVSQPVKRTEDQRFLRGTGRYIEDLRWPEEARAVFVRAPVAHADIASLEVEEARAAPGVLAVLTGADLDAAIDNDLAASQVENLDGSMSARPRRPLLAVGRVRHVGEAVALVVAETLGQAKDAAELVVAEYEDRPAVTETAAATAEGAPQLHDDAPNNLCYDWGLGDREATESAFADAPRRVTLDLVNNRVIANPMETRGAMAAWEGDRLHLAFNGQGPWGTKADLAKTLSIPEDKVRCTHPDVGGGFGMKTFTYPEHIALAHAARVVGRPVKWISERSEGMASDCMGRDHVTRVEGAFESDGRIRALRFTTFAGMGAYLSPFGALIPSEVASRVLTGVYDVQTFFLNVKGVFTNTTPVDAYRGAGRPESIYAIERFMDYAARELGVDPLTLRRRNFITEFPYKTCVGEKYDVGEFDRVMRAALEKADVAGFEARKRDSRNRGKLRGLGLCYYIESILGAQNETTRFDFAEDGGVDLYVGTQSNGQGHETVYAQFLTDRLGVPFERIRVIQGDTDRIPMGGGTGGSRSVTMQGSSIWGAADEWIERAKAFAGEELEVAAADVEFSDGAFRVAGTDRALPAMALAEAARRKDRTDLLTEMRENTVPDRSYPNGCHIAEVEVDPETGGAAVVKYMVVDDFGVLMNPTLAEGQVHGGVAQGIGQAITERVVWDEDGQLLSATFMDYAMPRADDVPAIPFHHEGVPSTANVIGMKGCGEAGTVGALAAVVNAALDAVWDQGVRHVDMPLTAERMWRWLQEARPAVAAE
jgi:carbon-monoxide dehydrogenase large subunit